MAKRFAGFTPEQMGKIIPEMKGMQADEQAKFLASQPGAAARVGKMAELAQKRIGMANGGYAKKQGYADGGIATIGEGNNQYFKVGGATFQDYGSALNHYNTSGGAAQFGALQNTTTTPNTTGGFDMGAGQQGQGNMASDLNKKIDGGYATADMQPIYDDAGNVISYGSSVYQPGQTIELPDYDPSTGLPDAPELKEVDALDFFKQNTGGGYYLPSYNETALAGLVNEGSDLTGATIEGNIVTFADGKTITANSPQEAEQVVNAASAYGKEVVQPNKAAQDTYNKQLDLYKQEQYTQAGEALTDVGASLDTAQKNLSQEQGALNSLSQQLSNLPPDDPQREVMQKLVDEQQVKVTVAKASLSQANANLARVGTDSTTELQAAALSDPMSMTTKADVATTSEAQKAEGMIAEGTGQAAAVADTATQTEADIAANAPLAKEFEAAG